jgi:hypothetical protein
MQVCARVYRSHRLVLYAGNYSTWWNLLVVSGAGNVTHGVMAGRWRLTGATISARLLCAGAYGGASPWGQLSRKHNVAHVWACLSVFLWAGFVRLAGVLRRWSRSSCHAVCILQSFEEGAATCYGVQVWVATVHPTLSELSKLYCIVSI